MLRRIGHDHRSSSRRSNNQVAGDLGRSGWREVCRTGWRMAVQYRIRVNDWPSPWPRTALTPYRAHRAAARWAGEGSVSATRRGQSQ